MKRKEPGLKALDAAHSGACTNQPGSTKFAVDLTFGVVVVRGVPALVCVSCGDAWIEGLAARLEEITAAARRNRAAVAVTQWPSAAA